MNPGQLPLIAIVGRPNVGKSTLFNRIVGGRPALVSKEPGMTRDRHIETGEWSGRNFRVVDTGGLQSGENFLVRRIADQVRKAIEEAALIFFVVDGRTGFTAEDEEIVALLRRSGRPVLLLVNKIDAPKNWQGSLEFHRFGFDKVIAISAEHGFGVDEALDEAIELLQLPISSPQQERADIPVVLLGKPNAGKSTFLNKLLGQERLVTSELPGTTRDTIDLLIPYEERTFRFIDTAGIRKKGATKTVPDKLAVIHARKSLDRAEIACIMIDGSEGVTHQDAVVAGYAKEGSKGIIILLNKMDLLDQQQRKRLEQEVESKLKFISFALRLYLSAKTGHNVGRVFPLLARAYESYTKRIGTGQLNAFFDKVLANRYIGSYKGKPIKLKYITQAGIKPPTFVLFTNAARQIHFSHRRYLENQLRNYFGFEGTSIRLKIKKQ